MSETLTTTQVAERLGVARPTVKLWCRQGRFPNAALEQTARGPVWQIPASDLKGFTPPKMGRPATKAAPAKPARKTRKKAEAKP